MRRASIVRAVMAVVAVLVSATAAATAANPATAAAGIVPIIPVPASIAPRAGSFIVRAGTPIYTSGDAEAARIAGYFADLLQRTHAIAQIAEKFVFGPWHGRRIGISQRWRDPALD